MGEQKNKLDLEAEAFVGLEKARAMLHGPERTKALKKGHASE